ncbi:MAG: branched-chain amino acid ABC transporter ATP-binding protein [Aquificota bacterium]|uniref:ABC transporter ATP-binding protein n=1 Tax=Thermosulfidibacter takaii TaxID=412593 RepID=A0A7C0Y8P6_9BACT|nr:MAG: branched-chain amino acid ABC transporter ATP-binding protein [Aquificota bacterium]HDD53369.1 ABC transporter ATP-binding protein [Thermosulfidibacter takaii]
MAQPALKVENLETGYGEVQILWGINLEVPVGNLTTILGANGAGKTTLLRAITGILPVWKGKVTFQGEDITRLSPHERATKGLIMIPEGRMIFPEMTVLENLEMGAFNKKARTNLKKNMEHAIALFPRLEERLSQRAGTLSGGEQQMLAIARGLMADPQVLIFDEPSLGLAPKLVIEVFETIQKLKEEGITMLLVEQNAHLSLAITDYAYVLAEGKVAMEGRGEELEESEEVKKAYLGV